MLSIIKIDTLDNRRLKFLTYMYEEAVQAWVKTNYKAKSVSIEKFDPFVHGSEQLYKVI